MIFVITYRHVFENKMGYQNFKIPSRDEHEKGRSGILYINYIKKIQYFKRNIARHIFHQAK